MEEEDREESFMHRPALSLTWLDSMARVPVASVCHGSTPRAFRVSLMNAAKQGLTLVHSATSTYALLGDTLSLSHRGKGESIVRPYTREVSLSIALL